MSTSSRKLREIEAETRFVRVDRILSMLVTSAFPIIVIALIAAAFVPTLVGLSQSLQHAVAVPPSP